MSYTKEQYEKEIKEWRKKHKGKVYLNPLKMPEWFKTNQKNNKEENYEKQNKV